MERTVEDRLREQYFSLLPEARSVLRELEAEVRHCLLPIAGDLDRYEQLEVTSRIKDCESAVEKLRGSEEGVVFDPGKEYSLESLKDLAGVRVLVFPRSRLLDANREFRKQFPLWVEDHVPADDRGEEPLAFKYFGYCSRSNRIRG